MQFPNPVLEKLGRGEVSIGTWLNLASPLAAEVMALAGYEWLVIDAEHSQWDLGLITEGFRAIEARDCVPMVRSWTDESTALARLLDAGAQGIVIPHVSTPEQAEAIAKAVRYPPRGERSGGSGRATQDPAYNGSINDNLIICPQIEDMEGVNNAAEIMAVDGMDVAYIGPGDLGTSMGLPQDQFFKHEDHIGALATILKGAKKNNKPAGTPVSSKEFAREAIRMGFTMIDLTSDTGMLKAAAVEWLEAVTG